MNGIRDVFNRALRTRRSSAYFFVESSESAVPESGSTVSDQHELIRVDRRPVVAVVARPALVRSSTQLVLSDLHADSKFSQREVNELYREFKHECPAGYITKDRFLLMFQKFFPTGGSDRYAGYVFDTFERDAHGRVPFRSFLLGMSVLSRGNTDEKLRWIFDLYDIDKNGYVTQEEMTEIVSAVYEMRNDQDAPSTPGGNSEAVIRHAKSVFQKMDVNNDGVVSCEEFIAACHSDAAIRDSIGTLNGGVRAKRSQIEG
ncbi:putative Calsenilin [Hypsibius exemplaris]|uniref:Calsenilin n=1 Tax=Hypsibius exemplaris TaxID=2072580 RepID=A0A1W0WQZ5_HYPEX|nr:putative Calsenilin [Hypsibius exemplaris]